MRCFESEKGGISVFQCILFSALLLFCGVLVDAVRIMTAERKVQSALNTSLRSVLAGYDKDLAGDFGLFGVDSSAEREELNNEFMRYLRINMEDKHPGLRFVNYEINSERTKLHGFGSLLDDKVYKDQILQYMKYKAPVTVTRGIVEKFTASGLFKKLKFAEKEKAVRDHRNEIRDKVDQTNRTVQETNSAKNMGLTELKRTRSRLRETLTTLEDINRSLNTGYKDAKGEVVKVLEERDEWEVDPQGKVIENLEGNEFNSIEGDSRILANQVEENIRKLNDIIAQIEELENQIESLRSEIASLQSQLSDSENESEKQSIRNQISRLQSEINRLQEEIRSLRENFRLNKLEELKPRELHREQDESEKPAGAGEKEGFKSFLDEIKGKIDHYIDNKAIDAAHLISQRDFETAAGGGASGFASMGDQSVEGLPVYENERQSKNAENTNLRIFDFLKSLFTALADSARNGTEKVYTVEYIMDKYTFTTSKTERNHFFEKGEIEYILWGDPSQLINIAKTMGSVSFLRFAINTVDYFATSKIVHPVVRLVYATGRGLIRSFSDMKELYGGKSVSLCPSLSGKELFKVSYPDHLRVFLLMQSWANEQGQLNNMRQLVQVNIKQTNSGYRLGSCSTVIYAKTEVGMNLWFLPVLQVDKLGFKGFENGKFKMVKEVYMGY